MVSIDQDVVLAQATQIVCQKNFGTIDLPVSGLSTKLVERLIALANAGGPIGMSAGDQATTGIDYDVATKGGTTVFDKGAALTL